MKTKMINSITEETRELLVNYGVYRAADMVSFFEAMKMGLIEQNKFGLALLKPLFIDEEGLHVEVIGIPVDEIAYNHETMNGLLYYPEANTIKDELFYSYRRRKAICNKKNKSIMF